MSSNLRSQIMIERAGSNAKDPKLPGFRTLPASPMNLSHASAWAIAAALILTTFPAPSAVAQERARATVRASRTIQIDVGGGELLRFGEDAGTVFVADPGIADIQAPSPASIFLFGKKAGRT